MSFDFIRKWKSLDGRGGTGRRAYKATCKQFEYVVHHFFFSITFFKRFSIEFRVRIIDGYVGFGLIRHAIDWQTISTLIHADPAGLANSQSGLDKTVVLLSP